MSCRGKTRVILEYPIKYTNYISYPTYCKHLDILAYYNYAEVVFPSIITGTREQISILGITTNTPVYDMNGAPVRATAVEPNRPYEIFFCPERGGYVLNGFICPTESVSEEVLEPTKGVSKK